MGDVLLAVDAGGTSLKYALMTAEVSSVPVTPICQEPTGASVLSSLARAAGDAQGLAYALGHAIVWTGVCCPGPFDFGRGVSMMRHKWQDDYEKPIAPVLRDVLGDIPIAFLHDSSAFMLGEGHQGAGRGHARVGGVMLGTGLGFAYMANGRVQVNDRQRPRISLWNTPFQGGTAEDYVSAAAIRAQYAARGGQPDMDVREIAHAAACGDAAAKDAFAGTGRFLARILEPLLEEAPMDHLVLGGQIGRAHALLIPHMRLPLSISAASHLDDAALRGIAVYGMLGHGQTMEVVESCVR